MLKILRHTALCTFIYLWGISMVGQMKKNHYIPVYTIVSCSLATYYTKIWKIFILYADHPRNFKICNCNISRNNTIKYFKRLKFYTKFNLNIPSSIAQNIFFSRTNELNVRKLYRTFLFRISFSRLKFAREINVII